MSQIGGLGLLQGLGTQLRRKIAAATAMVATLGVCAYVYFFLARPK